MCKEFKISKKKILTNKINNALNVTKIWAIYDAWLSVLLSYIKNLKSLGLEEKIF